MVDWSSLHYDLLVLIVRRIPLYDDFIAFGGVCQSWRFSLKQYSTSQRIPKTPCLMLAEKEGSSYLRGFFSLNLSLSKGIGGMTRQVLLPQAYGKMCFSSQGWLITIGKNLRIKLLHPFLRLQIKLPHMRTLFHQEIKHLDKPVTWSYAAFFDKIVLSASPSETSDYVVMAIYGAYEKFAFCRHGDKSWTKIRTKFPFLECFLDVVYYNNNNKFYCVDNQGGVFACDIRSPDPGLTSTPVTTLPEELAHRISDVTLFYLVESSGTLLLVSQQLDLLVPPVWGEGINEYWTKGFIVFEVGLDGREWNELKSLDNRALFLGHNSSISVEAFDFSGCIPNCIYFTDSFSDSSNMRIPGGGGRDMGIYNMLDGSIQPCYPGQSRSNVTPPMWVVPSLGITNSIPKVAPLV